MLGLQRDVYTGMATWAHGYVTLFCPSPRCRPFSTALGPRTLCNACGLVYAKLVRYTSLAPRSPSPVSLTCS